MIKILMSLVIIPVVYVSVAGAKDVAKCPPTLGYLGDPIYVTSGPMYACYETSNKKISPQTKKKCEKYYVPAPKNIGGYQSCNLNAISPGDIACFMTAPCTPPTP